MKNKIKEKLFGIKEILRKIRKKDFSENKGQAIKNSPGQFVYIRGLIPFRK